MGLPQSAAARALCNFGIPWDFPKTLALGGRAMLGLVGTAGTRWRWSPVQLWDSLGLVGTRWDSRDVHSSYVFLDCFAHLGLAGAGAFIILNNTHQPQMLDPRYSGATVILFLPSHSDF